MSTTPIDYEALAERARRETSGIDYDALAEQARNAAEQKPEQPGAVKEFLSGLGSELNPLTMAQGLANAAAHPLDTAKEVLWDAPGRTFEKAKDSFGKGNYLQAARHGADWLIPVVGSQIDELGDEAERGHVANASGKAVGLGLTMFGSNALGRVPAARFGALFKNKLNPVEETAVKSLEPDVDLSVGQKTGNKFTQRVEQMLPNLPGSSGTAQDFYRTQQGQLGKAGRDMAGTLSPVETDSVGAGQAVGERLRDRITKLKSQADNLYSQVRTAAAKNQQTIQVGTTPSGVLDANGNMMSTPVTKTLETPVDIAPVQAALKPVYDDLMSSMPEARRQASPAFKALQDLMSAPDTQMNAMDFDRSLGAIKSLTRDGSSPYLTSKSQGIAKQIIGAGERELSKALDSAGADVNSKFASARKMVRAYYDTDELLQDVERARNGEPAGVYNNLVLGGDRAFNALVELNKIAPKGIKTVGRTFIEGMLDKATAEGGFNKASTIFNEWQRMGPRTKEMLFGLATKDIDNFMLGAKKVTETMNPSGTSTSLVALAGSLGVGLASLQQLFSGNYVGAAALPAEAVTARTVAAALMSKSGVRALTKGFDVPMARLAAPAAAGAAGNILQQRPFATLNNDQIAQVMNMLDAGQDARIEDGGRVMMWRKMPDGSIKRLR